MQTKLRLTLSLCSLGILFVLMSVYVTAVWAYTNQQLGANVDVEYEPFVAFTVTTGSIWKMPALRQYNNTSSATTLGSITTTSTTNKFTTSPITVAAGKKLIYEIMIQPTSNTSLTFTFSDNFPLFSSATFHFNGQSSISSPCSKTSWGTRLTASGNTYTQSLRNKKNNYFYIVIENTTSSSMGYIANWVIT